jgi:hypothetical protein
MLFITNSSILLLSPSNELCISVVFSNSKISVWYVFYFFALALYFFHLFSSVLVISLEELYHVCFKKSVKCFNISVILVLT